MTLIWLPQQRPSLEEYGRRDFWREDPWVWDEEEDTMVSNTFTPPNLASRTGRDTITVARPFIYSFKDGSERRFDPNGNGSIPPEMMMNPWIYRDFADGRISHINGKPVHAPSQGPVLDYLPANREAMEQLRKVGRNQGRSLSIAELNALAAQSMHTREVVTAGGGQTA